MSELSSIELSCIKKADNYFSFTNEVINEIGNQTFLTNAADFISHQQHHVSTDTRYSYIWTALSACADEIGSKLYESILNYINDVCNIDVCKIQALQSMVSQLGIQYTIFNDIDSTPQELRDLIEVLSIKKEYLLSSSIVNSSLVEYLSANATTKVEDPRWTIDGLRPYIDSEKLDEIIISAYEKVLSSCVYLPYADSTTPIWFEQHDNIYLSGFVLTNANTNKIAQYKTTYGIRQDFDHVKIVDEIEQGLDDISSYLIPEQEVLQLEIDGRKQMLRNDMHQRNFITRYSYYRERLVKQVFEFIENQYCILKNNYLSAEQYEVDGNYLVVGNVPSQKKLLYLNDTNQYAIHDDMIHDVAEAMCELTKQIRYIRDDLKTQMQKNFIKGTYLLIKYVISEYIKNNTLPTIKKIYPTTQEVDDITVDKIEYIDPTQYFNISTSLSDDANKTLNGRYWENANGLLTIAAIDNTNIFVSPPTVANNSFAFPSEDISTFYYDVLKFSPHSETSNKYNVLTEFLNSVFDTGADKTFLSNGQLAVEKSDGTMTTVSSEVSAEWYAYKNALFQKYSGLSTANTPYAYVNEVHPSYQIHPFMSAFIESEDYTYPIDNIANLIAENMLEAIQPYLNSNELIDAEGYLQNIWKNPLNSNTDYLSRYERSSHRDSLNNENPVVSYDGLFYPEAVIDYLDNFETFMSDLSSVDDNGRTKNKWYKGLDISQQELKSIYTQLNSYYYIIAEIAGHTLQSTTHKCYDIYQYGIDTFGNQYILVKDLNTYSLEEVRNATFSTRKNLPGQLWMKKKNHPIAFPAIVISNDKQSVVNLSQLTYLTEGIPEIASASLTKLYADAYARLTPQIIDFSFDRSLKTLLLLCKNDSDSYVLIANSIMKSYSDDLEQYVISVKENKADLYDFSTNSIFQKWSYLNENTIAFFTNKLGNSIHSSVTVGAFKYDGKWTNGTTECTLKHSAVGEVALDHVSTSNKVVIAYVTNITVNENDSIVNYFNQYETFKDILMFSDVNKQLIATSRYQLSPTSLALIPVVDSTAQQITTAHSQDVRLYNYHTHLGFYPLANNTTANNVTIFNTTKAYDTIQKYGFAKCQLLCPSVDVGIDFKFMLPVRMYEKFDLSKNIVESYQLSNHSKYASFNYAHYNENAQLSNIITENLIYNPYDIARIVQDHGIIQDGNIQLRVDESFFNEYSMESEMGDSPKYDPYAPYPFLVLSASDSYIEGKAIGKYAQTTSCCIFSLYSDENIDEISVSWTKYHYYSGKEVIKLDFNADYYNNPPFQRNYYNRRHTFLNLDVPGYAGYLMTYDSENALKHIYFIKNVSDSVPKFLISADTYIASEPIETNYDILITEDSNVAFEEISAIATDNPVTIYLGV